MLLDPFFQRQRVELETNWRDRDRYSRDSDEFTDIVLDSVPDADLKASHAPTPSSAHPQGTHAPPSPDAQPMPSDVTPRCPPSPHGWRLVRPRCRMGFRVAGRSARSAIANPRRLHPG